jgi:glycosyltransferase involved in cell wall biosynthesis
VFETSQSRPGLTVYHQEFWLPKFYWPPHLARATFLARVRRAQHLLRNQGCTAIILYLWRPNFDMALDAGGWALTAYHIDDEYSFSDVDLPNSPEEVRILRRVDQVFIHSATVMEKKGGLNPHSVLSPNGVDYAAFSTPAPEPADLARIPHPRIGYAGFIKKQLDWDLLHGLATRRPDWSFVMVGKRRPHPELPGLMGETQTMANVHFLGDKPANDLARYPQHFDVCVMPYVTNGYTRYIYPMKLHECLASGRPVVSTPLPSLVEFRGIVAMPANRDDWIEAICAALRPEAQAPGASAARRAVAMEYDWDVLAARIARVMAERLGATGMSPGRGTNETTGWGR